MSKNPLDYFHREHARLEAEIERQRRRPRPDDMLIARLRRVKLVVRDQMAAWARDLGNSQVA